MTGPRHHPDASTSRSVIDRFLAMPTTTGRTESVAGGGRIPASEEFTRLAGELAQAAAIDPVPFTLPDALRDADTLASVLHAAGDRLRTDGRDAVLELPQQHALEAIVRLTGRPALLVRDNWIELPSGPWERLLPYRDAITRAIGSVGRLNVAAGYGVPYAGTGFVVGDGLVMTNRHVVEPYVTSTGWLWELDPGCALTFDVTPGSDSTESRGYRVASIVWIDDRDGVDLAVLQLADPTAGEPAWPPALALQAEANRVAERHTVYVVGYPAADGARNAPAAMQGLFGDVYGAKRLAPGQITAVNHSFPWFEHDCTTLGGNSGSCVIDLATNAVVGLHCGGEYGVANQAVSLPLLHADPSLHTLAWRSGRDD